MAAISQTKNEQGGGGAIGSLQMKNEEGGGVIPAPDFEISPIEGGGFNPTRCMDVAAGRRW